MGRESNLKEKGMKVDLEEIERKAYRYSQQDGFTEIFMGLFFIVYGGICHDIFSDLEVEFPVVPFIVFFVFFGAFLEIIRSRVTYPRIGRVKITERIESWFFIAVILPFALFPLILYAAFTLFGDVVNLAPWVKWAPALLGAVLVGLFYRQARRGTSFYYGFAALSAVAGALLSIVDFSPASKGILFFFLSLGGLLILFGVVMLVQFLLKYPAVKEGDDVT